MNDPDSPRGRAALLESEAEELRRRLDELLAELRHHRRRAAMQATLVRRYVFSTLIGLVLAGTGTFAFLEWRRRRRRVTTSWQRRLGTLVLDTTPRTAARIGARVTGR